MAVTRQRPSVQKLVAGAWEPEEVQIMPVLSISTYAIKRDGRGCKPRPALRQTPSGPEANPVRP
jgi:hypothetical protein